MWAYRQDQLPTTHPIAADIVDIEAVTTNFDGITYAKGASVLKQLAHWVGHEAFFAATRAYFGKHAYCNTTLQDLLDDADRGQRPRPVHLVEGVAADAPGVNTLRPRLRGRRGRRVHLRSRSSRTRRRTTRRCARTGCGSGCSTTPTTG